jgi:hypothetical protein
MTTRLIPYLAILIGMLMLGMACLSLVQLMSGRYRDPLAFSILFGGLLGSSILVGWGLRQIKWPPDRYE